MIDAEDLARMEAPCMCNGCGEWFDLDDGYGCRVCHTVVCEDCIIDGYYCPLCDPERGGKDV